MARYAIGDIQGCYKQLIELTDKIGFSPSRDQLYLVGDLVNRGPQSLEVLQWIYKYQDSIINVLGNHDIYLLARHQGICEPDDDETIHDILNYPQVNKLMDWLKCYSLIVSSPDYILVHAGIYPHLDFNMLLSIDQEFSENLKAHNNKQFLRYIFGNKPNKWSDDLTPYQQMKFLVNSCTRMRYLDPDDYSINYKAKGGLGCQPDNLVPWFKLPFHPTIDKKILFGHWAALGFYHDAKFISLDTGCVWGRRLIAINLDTYELFQVPGYSS